MTYVEIKAEVVLPGDVPGLLSFNDGTIVPDDPGLPSMDFGCVRSMLASGSLLFQTPAGGIPVQGDFETPAQLLRHIIAQGDDLMSAVYGKIVSLKEGGPIEYMVPVDVLMNPKQWNELPDTAHCFDSSEGFLYANNGQVRGFADAMRKALAERTLPPHLGPILGLTPSTEPTPHTRPRLRI